MGFYYFCGKFRETGTYKTLYKCLSSISAVHFSVFVVRPEIVTVSRWQGSAGSKMKKTQSFTYEIYFLEFISGETRVQLLQAQDRRKVVFQHQIMKNQKPGPVRGHGILPEQMA